jgi:hypothetical protein
MKRKVLIIILAAAFIAAALAASPQAGDAKGRKGDGSRGYIEGTVIGIGGRFGGTRPFKLIVDSFTTPEQVGELSEALQIGGQDTLLYALSKLKAGRIEVGNGVGVTANAIFLTSQAGGGTKVTVLYERTLDLYELRGGTRSEEYPFGEAEIYLDANGRAEGTFIPAAQIRESQDGSWGVEDFGEFPARIVGIRVRG